MEFHKSFLWWSSWKKRILYWKITSFRIFFKVGKHYDEMIHGSTFQESSEFFQTKILRNTLAHINFYNIPGVIFSSPPGEKEKSRTWNEICRSSCLIFIFSAKKKRGGEERRLSAVEFYFGWLSRGFHLKRFALSDFSFSFLESLPLQKNEPNNQFIRFFEP